MPERQEVFEALIKERDYQDALNPRELSIGEEIALMNKYLLTALADWSNDFSDVEQMALADIRKVVAIGLRCLEHHGCPQREDWNQQLIDSRKLKGWG